MDGDRPSDDALRRYVERATPEERERLGRMLAERGSRIDAEPRDPLSRTTLLCSRLLTLAVLSLYLRPDVEVVFASSRGAHLGPFLLLVGLILAWFPNRIARVMATRHAEALAYPPGALLVGWTALVFPLVVRLVL